MKVNFRQSGGFAGLVLGCDLDTQTMAAAEAGELLRLVRQAGLEKVGTKTSTKGADLTRYEIVVTDNGRSIKAVVDDMTIPDNVRPLMEFLSRRSRAVAPNS
jgi:hypothetical protein